MPVDPLAEQGFNAATSYELGRPGYAPAAVERVVSELGLGATSRVLDLAAGTGQLSRALLPLVGSLVAVEPSAAMRAVLAERVPAAEVLAGEAAGLPLPDEAVDAVVVGEAFHWFAGEPALDEIARVLRPLGGLALLWNVALAAEPRWPVGLSELLRDLRAAAVTADRRYDSGAWRQALERDPRFERLASASAEHVQRLDREGLTAQIASYSYVASLPDAERQTALDQVRELLPAQCAITLRTDAHWTRRV